MTRALPTGLRHCPGTSAGAINAALIAAGKSPDELAEFWNGIADNPPATASAAFFEGATRALLRLSFNELVRWLVPGRRWKALLQRARNHLPPRPGTPMALMVEYLLTTRFELVSHFMEGIREPFLADTRQLRERLVEALGGEKVPSNGIRLAINTVDAHTGLPVRFVNVETPLTRGPDYVIVDAIDVDIILASASIPLLFPPVPIGPHLLWDGGLLVNTPLAPLVALGAEEIITVLVTEPPDVERGPFEHFGRAVERAIDSFLENAYNVDRKLLLERNRLAHLEGGAGYRDVVLYEALRPARDRCFNAGSYLYFERDVLAEMHEAGQRAADAWLDAGPLVDHLDAPAEALAS